MAKKRGKQKSMRSSAPIRPPAVKAANGEVQPPIRPIISPPKVCRLCEMKEGPFLNIFGGENNTAKKIEELMPFGVAENDELPHKICFRCSAKVEELHEFVQKCIKTQENLYNAMGKSIPTKVKKHRSLWEEKLNRSNITNDDICDAVIKKAMEGIKDVSLQLLSDNIKSVDSQTTPEKSLVKTSKATVNETTTKSPDDKNKEEETASIKKANQGNECINKNKTTSEVFPEPSLKLCLDKCDEKISPKTRSSRSNNDTAMVEGIPTKKNKKTVKSSNKISNKTLESKTKTTIANLDTHVDKEKEDVPNIQQKDAVVIQQTTPEKSVEKPFNIMDHVSMIKVNGVGVLFQCKLCNRNFLKKDVVLSHWCAKNGVAKDDFIKRAAPPEVPRIPTVKYINTKIDDSKKQQGPDSKNTQIKTAIENTKRIEFKVDGETIEKKSNVTELKSKPKIGPASKVKRTSLNSTPVTNAAIATVEPTPQEKNSSLVQCPAVPSLNCRYKLVPGPNNTFTLVEAHPTEHKEETITKEQATHVKKRKFTDEDIQKTESSSKQRKVLRSENAFLDKIGTDSKSSPDVIELSDQSHTETANQPYPVGLFQTVSRHSNNEEPPAPAVVPFATSAQKKQSYTIVQTGNPSKLLISAKPQPPKEEIPKKKSKKVKPVQENTVAQEPFSVTLEDTTHPKDSGFFTFINVDPLLQPSYVLPTDTNIIQESRISASKQLQKSRNSGKSEQYTCNMCNEVFTREQKLLVHIHSHYNKMDEEDQMRAEKPSRKRGKKS